MRFPHGRSLLVALLLAPPGIARAAELEYPLAVAADNTSIYLADRTLPAVWKIADGKLQLLFQGQKKFRTPLNAVRCVAVDPKGRLLAGDSSTREVYRFNADNQPEPLTKGGIGTPMAIAVDGNGDIFVADIEIQRIVKVPDAGGEPTEFATLTGPRGLTFDAQGRLWAVSAAGGKSKLVRYASDGTMETVVEGKFNFPHHVAVDPQGNAYVADNYEVAIWKITPDGTAEKWAQGAPLVRPVGVAWQNDRLLVADPHAKQVFAVTPDGKIAPLEYAR